MTPKDKVEFLFKEKEIVRQEILLHLKTLFSSLFSFIAVFAVFVGLYLGQKNGNDKFINVNTPSIIFIVEQIEFVICLFNFSQQSGLSVLTSYCRALEEKINALSKDNISIWESSVVNDYVYTPKSSQYYTLIILYGFYITSYIYLGFLLCRTANSVGYILVLATETATIIPLYILISREKKKSYRFISNKIDI